MRIHDESGVTAVEYGLLLALVGIVFVAIGPQLYDVFLALINNILDGLVG